jgi:hypothetical protein
LRSREHRAALRAGPVARNDVAAILPCFGADSFCSRKRAADIGSLRQKNRESRYKDRLSEGKTSRDVP